MIGKVKIYLEQGQYTELEECVKGLEFSVLRDVIMEIGYEMESIHIYGYITYMLRKTNSIEWLKLAIEVMINPLCFIDGAYSIALFHTRELLTINRNVENLERILFFYSIPERLVDKREARRIAEEILSIEPNNKVALEIMNESGEQ